MKKPSTTRTKLEISTIILLILSMTSCSQYKSTWSCKVAEGLGCTSVAYADEIARKEIILNDFLHQDTESTRGKRENKVLITKHYSDLELRPETEIALADVTAVK